MPCDIRHPDQQIGTNVNFMVVWLVQGRIPTNVWFYYTIDCKNVQYILCAPKCGDEKYVKTPANAGIFIVVVLTDFPAMAESMIKQL